MTRTVATIRIGPQDVGRSMDPGDFLAAEYDFGWRYELVEGRIRVRPMPSRQTKAMIVKLIAKIESHGEGRLGPRSLRKMTTPKQRGRELLRKDSMMALAPEELVTPNGNVRCCDLAVEIRRKAFSTFQPIAAVDFVWEDAAGFWADQALKRADYLGAGLREYWIIDYAERTLAVLTRASKEWKERLLQEDGTYISTKLFGFSLKLATLLAVGDRFGMGD